jgi:glycosyltransferase involved in cell wall biosynthesis
MIFDCSPDDGQPPEFTMTPQKRVAVFRNNFLPLSETFIHDEMRFHRRYEATAFARKRMHEDEFPGHRVVGLEGRSGWKRIESFLYHHLGVSWSFHHELSQRRYDILHAHFGYNGVYALPFAIRLKIPLVVSLHGLDVAILERKHQYRIDWWMYRRRIEALERYASAFLCASADIRVRMRQMGFPNEKLIVHPLGIDLQKFTIRRLPGLVRKVVMIGRFVEKKGFEDGLRAFAACCRDGLEALMILVGQGPLRATYEEVVRKHMIESRVQFVGPKTSEGIRDILQEADVVLVPSVKATNGDSEAIPTVIKEAMACQVPVIGTRHGGIPEIIEDGVSGYLVDEHDIAGMADRLARLLTFTDEAWSMGQAARAHVERHFNVVTANERLESIYDRFTN